LTEIGFENNELLEELYIANCSNTSTTLDLSTAPNLKLLDATNSSFTSIKIADGAPLESLKAGNPETLVLSNLRKLETLDIDYTNLSTLHLNNIDFIKNTSK
jgi:hypothetical protein